MRRLLAVPAAALTAALSLAAVTPAATAATPGRSASPSLASGALASFGAPASTVRTGLAIVARPTDGNDPRGDSYTTDNVKMKCSAHICVHWVNGTADKVADGWQDTTLTQMNKVWGYVVGDLGYRPPLGDGKRGGNAKLDVYLKDLGSRGYAGYCALERVTSNGLFATSYCVLDNDFDRTQFDDRPPVRNLRTTAVHEFFRAVQYAYDSDEDDWFVESTATWMEEQYADDVNTNRDFIQYGQVAIPSEPLDLAVGNGYPQFGDWVFWEYLSQRLGKGIVKSVWTKAGEFKDGGQMYSTQALVSALKNKGTFAERFALYASSNTAPGKSYSEGGSWGQAAPMEHSYTLTSGSSATDSVTIDHLASSNIKITPSYAVTGKNQRVRIDVDGPSSKSAPRAVVAVTKKDGTIARTVMTLDGSGVGHASFLFDANQISFVTLTLVNASTHYACWTQPSADPSYSCQGSSSDDNRVFTYTARSTTV